MCLENSKSQDKLVDIFTKPLQRDKFVNKRNDLGIGSHEMYKV